MSRLWRNPWVRWFVVWAIIGGAIVHMIQVFVLGIKIWYHIPYFGLNLFYYGAGNVIGSFVIFAVWLAIGVLTAPRGKK